MRTIYIALALLMLASAAWPAYVMVDMGVSGNALAINPSAEQVTGVTFSNSSGALVMTPYIWSKPDGVRLIQDPYFFGARVSVSGINSNGEICGDFSFPGPGGKAISRVFVWSDLEGIRIIEDGDWAISAAINDLGNVAYWVTGPTTNRGKVFVKAYGDSIPVATGFMKGLNNAGYACGMSTYPSNGDAVRWGPYTDAKPIPPFIGPKLNWMTGVANDINESLKVVGQQRTLNATGHAFYYDSTVEGALPVDLGKLVVDSVGYDLSSSALGINSSDKVCGWAYVYNWKLSPIVWDVAASTFEILPVPEGGQGRATGINDAGVICGWVTSPAGTRAVVWEQQ